MDRKAGWTGSNTMNQVLILCILSILFVFPQHAG
jgi:hypothetical protein